MAFAARLTEESIIRAKHAPLGWVSPIQVVYVDEGLVQCLVDVGGFQGRDATCMLRMLTSRRCAQAHAPTADEISGGTENPLQTT